MNFAGVQSVTIPEGDVKRIAIGGVTVWTKPNPYDAEIEYLESTGTQYIDTGVLADGSVLSAEIDVDCSLAGQFAGAVRGHSVRSRMHFGVASGYDTIYIGSRATNGSAWFRTSQTSGRRVFRYDAQNQTGAIGSYTGALVPVAPTDTTISFWLFGRHGLNTANTFASARIYAAKLWQSGVLVRSYVPVRVGQVGYLFDRVSGTLFGNAGTDAFTIGPDK